MFILPFFHSPIRLVNNPLLFQYNDTTSLFSHFFIQSFSHSFSKPYIAIPVQSVRHPLVFQYNDVTRLFSHSFIRLFSHTPSIHIFVYPFKQMKVNMVIIAVVICSVLPYTLAWKCESFCNEEAHKCLTSCIGYTGCVECTSSADSCRSTCRRRRTIADGLQKRFQFKNEDAQ